MLKEGLLLAFLLWFLGLPFLWEREIGITGWQLCRVYSRLLFFPIMMLNGFIRFIVALIIYFVLVFFGVHLDTDAVFALVDKITLRNRFVSSYFVFD